MLRKITLPQWLDGQTIALLTLLAALGAMMQTGFIDIRGEIRQLRTEVRDEIGQLRSEVRDEIGQVRDEMGQVRGEIGQLRSEVRMDLHRLDDRLRNVELEVTSIKAGMAPATVQSRSRQVESRSRHRVKGRRQGSPPAAAATERAGAAMRTRSSVLAVSGSGCRSAQPAWTPLAAQHRHRGRLNTCLEGV